MLNRRGFIGLLSAAGASLALPSGSGWTFLTQETPTFAPIAGRVPITNIATLTQAVAWHLGDFNLHNARLPFLVAADREAKIGDRVAGYELQTQLGVDMLFDNWNDVLVDADNSYARPIAAALYRAIDAHKVRVFGRLALPGSSLVDGAAYAFDPKSSIGVRGVYVFEPPEMVDREWWTPKMRFDVLVGQAEGLSH